MSIGRSAILLVSMLILVVLLPACAKDEAAPAAGQPAATAVQPEAAKPADAPATAAASQAGASDPAVAQGKTCDLLAKCNFGTKEQCEKGIKGNSPANKSMIECAGKTDDCTVFTDCMKEKGKEFNVAMIREHMSKAKTPETLMSTLGLCAKDFKDMEASGVKVICGEVLDITVPIVMKAKKDGAKVSDSPLDTICIWAKDVGKVIGGPREQRVTEVCAP